VSGEGVRELLTAAHVKIVAAKAPAAADAETVDWRP
jgi:hypothetical protein